MTMKNLFRLLFCTFLMTCGSDEDSGNDNVINLSASISTNVSSLSFENTMVTQISDSQVILRPENSSYSDIEVNPKKDNLIFEGTCVGLLRDFS